MSYAQDRDFLAKFTKLVELTDNKNVRVAIAPEWQGRVMTSTCGGPEGPSFGFINREFIESGRYDPRFNNYGAEERMWLCPQGGQYSLWFKPGAEQIVANRYNPPVLNEGGWNVVSKPDDPSVRMVVPMKLENASAATFNVEVTREVRLLGIEDLGELFGDPAADAMVAPNLKLVAFETANTLTNRGSDFSKEKGLLSIWILGMFNAGPQTIAIVPYKRGPESELGPVVKSDYYGIVPADRLKIIPKAILFSGDGRFRAKIGVSQRRARNVLGSIDFEEGVLTLASFTMPNDPSIYNYLNNMWQLPQASPYTGDVSNAYNDGPNELGRQLGAYYELESASPAIELKTGESLTHRHRTIHIKADAQTLNKLAKDILDVDLNELRKAMPAH